jgi:hypothetical protein
MAELSIARFKSPVKVQFRPVTCCDAPISWCQGWPRLNSRIIRPQAPSDEWLGQLIDSEVASASMRLERCPLTRSTPAALGPPLSRRRARLPTISLGRSAFACELLQPLRAAVAVAAVRRGTREPPRLAGLAGTALHPNILLKMQLLVPPDVHRCFHRRCCHRRRAPRARPRGLCPMLAPPQGRPHTHHDASVQHRRRRRRRRSS